MAKNYDFEYIVIGSGPAGRTISTKLAEASKKVAMIELDPTSLGGAEINTRDLPYKISLDFAHSYYTLASHPALSTSSFHFNFPTLVSNQNHIISSTRSELEKDLISLGITIIYGFANFLDSHTVAVGNTKYTTEKFVIATGSVLKANEISGLEKVKFLTPDTIFSTRRLPEFVFVVGGGPTGVEIAEYFAMLGTSVIIMERGNQLLPREDEDISKLITDHLENDLNVTVMTNAKVVEITEDYDSKIVIFTDGSGEKMVRVDTIVLATGSEPYLDYGLENAGVEYKRTGIIVDKYFSTSAKNIFAIGDCIATADSSSERAVYEAEILAENLLHRGKTTANYKNTTRIIATNPEIIITGLNERDATTRDLNYKKSLTPLEGGGFIKVLTDRSNHTLGTCVVSKNAISALELGKLLTK